MGHRTPLEIALIDLLYEALIVIRRAARDNDAQVAWRVADGIHNLDLVLRGEGDVQRLLVIDLEPMAEAIPELRMAVTGVRVEWRGQQAGSEPSLH